MKKIRGRNLTVEQLRAGVGFCKQNPLPRLGVILEGEYEGRIVKFDEGRKCWTLPDYKD